MLWDIFCKVIDNHGDIGVCWRLSCDLANKGQQVRLWVDDATALGWMAPLGHPAVQVLAWGSQPAGWEPGDVVIEAFGCELDPAVQEAIARCALRLDRAIAWINLEYLSAEPFAMRCHRLASPVMAGPAAGLTKHFFYPGFTPGTGGLLREGDLMQRQQRFDASAWLRERGIATDDDVLRVSLFCYEPPALRQLLARWAAGAQRVALLVTAGRAAAAVDAALAGMGATGPLSIHRLALMSQPEYDHLLWACDLNFVRGEDSLVRALWSGKPLVWQIYPQHDGAHQAKLDAFLGWLKAPASLREFHIAWNDAAQSLPPASPAQWSDCAHQARLNLLSQDDLSSQLLGFAAGLLTKDKA